ncbi:MAG: T9SS type A sorting domain-containing protein [Chitinophagales bacterium]|nr:T9SS type A sorting domain-containing protein [Chitinophagales bacterium]
MKKMLLLLFFIFPFIASAQTIIIDDFESYAEGDLLAANSDVWTTWSGGIDAEDAPISSDEASSGINSVHVVGNVGPTDLILPFPEDYTSGVYDFSLKMFFKEGYGGYFNIQQSSVPGVDWMFEIYFDDAGGGYINAGGFESAYFEYVPEKWNDVFIKINLTDDEAQLWVNSISVYTWQWSLGALGLSYVNAMGGVDIFAYAANAGDADFFIDDVSLSKGFATGIQNEIADNQFQIFPNPSNGEINLITNNFTAGEYEMQVVDVLGNIVSTKNIYLSGNEKENLNLDLAAGIYYLRLLNGNISMIKKIIVE